MLYTNYKQVVRLVLKSEDAIKDIVGTHTIQSVAGLNSIGRYTFNINMPFYKFSKNTKLAVEKLSVISNDYIDNTADIGDIYLLNIKKQNVFHSSKKKGTCIYSGILSKTNEYVNPDVINNSIDITGNTGFLEGNTLDIFVDTFVIDDSAQEIQGCSEGTVWSLSLIIYEEEKEENPKDNVQDGVKNHSKPVLY